MLFVAFIMACLPSTLAFAHSRASFDTRRVQQFESAAKNLEVNSGGVLLVDSDNVRGKALFGISHLPLIARTARWAQRQSLSGHVLLLVDHGSLPTSHRLPALGVSAAFSGPYLSADDVAARDVQ